MVLRDLLGDGVQVDTVLADGPVAPGGVLSGEVRLVGGSRNHRLQGITLGLVVGGSREGDVELDRQQVAAPRTLPAGTRGVVPFQMSLPWDTPLTTIGGRRASRAAVRIRTEVRLAGALDKNDSDPVIVCAAPVQQRVIEAMYALGYRFREDRVVIRREADVAPAIRQYLRFRSPGYADAPITVVFVAGPRSVDLTLLREGTEVAGSSAGAFAELAVDLAVDVAVLGHVEPPYGDTTGAVHTTGQYVRSTVDYSWLDEDLDWEGWITERIDAVRSAR